MRNLNHENPLRIAEVRRISVQKRSNSLALTLQTLERIKISFSDLLFNLGQKTLVWNLRYDPTHHFVVGGGQGVFFFRLPLLIDATSRECGFRPDFCQVQSTGQPLGLVFQLTTG